MVVKVGKLHFIRRSDARNPLRSFAIPPKGFLVCVDPEWVTFISGATAKPKSGDYPDSIFSDEFEKFFFTFLASESDGSVEAASEKANVEDIEELQPERTYDILDELDSTKGVILHPEGDIYGYLNYLRDVKGQGDLAEEIHIKYKKAREEMVNHYEIKHKRLQYPAVAEKFNEMREKWELKDEGRNFKLLMESSSRTVCLANWGILTPDFRVDIASLFKIIKLSTKAMSDISFIMAYLLFNDVIESKLCHFIPLFPKVRIIRSGLGSRVFAEIPLEGDAKDFNNFSQLVKIIKNIELGYKTQVTRKKRDMDYDEETKYLWYHLHNQGQSWGHISRVHNEANPSSNATRDKVRKAVERLFD